ncbi:hypothetical protein D3C71_25590 [compost metagenome]
MTSRNRFPYKRLALTVALLAILVAGTLAPEKLMSVARAIVSAQEREVVAAQAVTVPISEPTKVGPGTIELTPPDSGTESQ